MLGIIKTYLCTGSYDYNDEALFGADLKTKAIAIPKNIKND
jgi:hypothetical protein